LVLAVPAAVLGLVGIWLLRPEPSVAPSPAPVPPPSATPDLPGRIAFSPPDPATLAKVPSPPLAVALGAPGTPPDREVRIVADLLLLYRRAFAVFPAGESNAQILNALRGNNPQRLPIFPAGHPRLNADGALCDAWGMPFFFHQISREEMTVRSAGPDRALFTADDLTAVPGR
jgi:hypothetical protein